MSVTDNTNTGTAALSVEKLQMSYIVRGTPREVLRGVSFEVRPGEAYGLVGESGCGKSTTAYAALRYLPDNGRIDAGRVTAAGRELTTMSARDLRQFRSHEASMVYQDPVQAVNPVLKIGRQVAESFAVLGQSKAESKASAIAALRRVHIAAPESVMDRYPHQLSGGMLQRVVIAMALAGDPKLLVLDEPTTGLDATVEAEVLDLVRELRGETGAAILLIAHNLGVIRTMCDRVGVMYAGRIVEEGEVADVFDNPSHPYTKGLLNSIPRHGIRKTDRELFAIPGNLPQIGDSLPTCVYVDRCPIATDLCRTDVPPKVDRTSSGHWARCHFPDRIDEVPDPEDTEWDHDIGTEEIIGVHGVSKTFHQRGHDVPALVSVDLGFADGETLGLVGESGSGKSTLAKTMLGVHEADEGGAITLRGRKMKGKATERVDESIRAIQMVFQNPDSALNRSWTVRRILTRSITKLTGLKGDEADKRAQEVAEAMRLSPRHLDMRPRQLSGGLKQRVAIARAFAGDPEVVVCDEPTSALDVSVQAAILNLLASLQRDVRTSYLFISHDIGVVRYLADRIAVMYVGRIVELGTTEQIFDGPNHPYTEALLSAVPNIDGVARERIPLSGEIPSPANPPSGCVFHTRCHRVIMGLCDVEIPEPVELEPGHTSACHLTAEQLAVPVKIAPATV
jgi:peptide/nickel transport system ATP-binding protein